MLRRIAAVSSAALLILSACSGSDGDTGDTTTTTADTTATTVAAAPPGSTMAPFEPAPGTPPAELRSYTTTSVFRVDVPPMAINVASTGTHVDGSYQCATDLDMDDNALATTVVSTPDGLFVDAGSGFTEVPAESAANTTAGCPADPAFWTGFSLIDIPEDLPTEAVEVNGIPGRQVDLVSQPEVADRLGLVPELEGATYDEFTMTFAEDGDWLLAMHLLASLTPEAASEAFGVPPEESTEGATISMNFDIADPDDPDLTVETPATGG